MVSVTSARLREGRLPEPAKITSSISPPRIRLAELSPITQRKASTRLDLPQPLGPTMPVSPGSIASSVGSTNDLNPASRSRSTCILAPSRPRLHFRRDRCEYLIEALKGRLSLEFLAVDEEGRGRIDTELLAGDEPAVGDLVLDLLVGHAGLEILFAHAGE